MEGEAREEERTGAPVAKDEMCVEIERIWNVGCVGCDDMPQGIYDSESEDEDELINMRGEWEELSREEQEMDGDQRQEAMIEEAEWKARMECEQLMKQEEDWLESLKTWPEPGTRLLLKQEARKGKK